MASEFPVTGDDLKKIVKKSRTMPIAFGFNPGTTDEDDEYLAAHARKKPEMLGKLALHDGAGTKTAFGTLQAVSSELRLTCFRTLPQLAKKIKRYLKRSKINLNVVVLDPDGNVIDCDIEVLTEWEGDDGGASDGADAAVDAIDPAVEERMAELDAAPDPAADPRELAARMQAIQPGLASVPADLADRVQAGFAGAAAMIRAGKLTEAEASISKLEMVMARLAMARVPPKAGAKPRAAKPGRAKPDAAKSDAAKSDARKDPPKPDARLPKLRGVVDGLSSRLAAMPDTDALSARLAQATDRIDAGEAEAAMGMIREVQAALAVKRGEAAKWNRAEAMVAPLIAAALQGGDVADPEGLRARWAVVTGLAEEGAWDRALAEMPEIVGFLRMRATP
ncbi:MAG: hypothetical protein ACK4L4_13555 [Gemmobacter sp.]